MTSRCAGDVHHAQRAVGWLTNQPSLWSKSVLFVVTTHRALIHYKARIEAAHAYGIQQQPRYVDEELRKRWAGVMTARAPHPMTAVNANV
ncbi:hypothetical protein [Bradyrhizobium sp. 171]|uniref:hypothetical protein n=2 Tax=unclassified Bradyrhizobium TaxID=2631580 RepID=UPI001FF7545B|nr:hypothetical protein [Bradyrhizobium sp. 171]MCK1560396.1 hypothetical protein [Bradyrhizobium sp. 171]